MPDEITDTAAPVIADDPAVLATATPAPEVKTFTQDQVNAFVQQRLAADRATRSKPEPSKPEPMKLPAKGEDSDVRAELEEMKLRNAFDKRIAKYDSPDEVSERLFKLYKVEKPEDPAAWTEVTAKQFGLRSLSQPVTPTVSTTGMPVPEVKSPAAAPNAPAKVDSATAQGLPNPWALTSQQIDELGPQGCRDMLEKLTTVGRARLGTPPPPRLPPRK
jgi:hypothetical protein